MPRLEEPLGIAIMVALISGLASLLAGSTLLREVFHHQCGMTPARDDHRFECDSAPRLSISGGSMTRQTMKTLRRWRPTVLLLRRFMPHGGSGSVE